MSDHKDVDELSGVETTGHEWDGMKELNNPLPRWWLWVWAATTVWAFGYWVFYPAWPGITGYTAGLLNNSDRVNVERDVADLQEARSGLGRRLMSSSLEEAAQDPDIFEFVQAAGSAAFGLHCATCHGSGAQGAVGYPNLNDDVWLWGGTLEDIQYTIRHGIRNLDDDNARFSQMPAFHRDQLITTSELNTLTDHVMWLSGRGAENYNVAAGQELYEFHCESCHMADGTGDPTQGAPNLTDALWLYGGDRDIIRGQIANPRNGVMPPWEDKLDDLTVRALTVYVHTLGGGE